MTPVLARRESQKEEALRNRRARSNGLRRMPWAEFQESGYGWHSILIGDVGEEWLAKWDYSVGDILFYDARVIPKAGDVVLCREDDSYFVKIFEPVARKTGVKKHEKPAYDEDGFAIPPEPEFEVIEKVDKSIVGVVMFDIRRRSMP